MSSMTLNQRTSALDGLSGVVTFPAIKGVQGHGDGRVEYFVTNMRFAEAARLIKGVDRYSMAANEKEAREIASEARSALERFNRIPTFRRFREIYNYVVQNEDYRFSALTVAYGGPGTRDAVFTPLSEILGASTGSADQLGILKLGLNDQLVIVDGQHRLGAILRVANSPDFAAEFEDHTIPVVIFPYLSLEACQQLFSDLNRTAKKTSRSLDITWDRRDALNRLILDLVGSSEDDQGLVPEFNGLVDFENVTVPSRSAQLATVSVIYSASEPLISWMARKETVGSRPTPDAVQALLVGQSAGRDAVVELLTATWKGLFERLPSWIAAREGSWSPDQRKDSLDHISGVVNAFGLFLADLLSSVGENDWRPALEQGLDTIGSVDWSRRSPGAGEEGRVPVRDCWQGIAMNGEQVIAPSNLKPNVRALLCWLARLPATTETTQSLYQIFEGYGRQAFLRTDAAAL